LNGKIKAWDKNWVRLDGELLGQILADEKDSAFFSISDAKNYIKEYLPLYLPTAETIEASPQVESAPNEVMANKIAGDGLTETLPKLFTLEQVARRWNEEIPRFTGEKRTTLDVLSAIHHNGLKAYFIDVSSHELTSYNRSLCIRNYILSEPDIDKQHKFVNFLNQVEPECLRVMQEDIKAFESNIIHWHIGKGGRHNANLKDASLFYTQHYNCSTKRPMPIFGEGFSEDTLTEYLELETWTPVQAAMLVCGIMPHQNCTEIPKEGAFSLGGELMLGYYDCFHYARRILEIWNSRENAPATIRPSEFVAWCKSNKGIKSDWLWDIEIEPKAETIRLDSPTEKSVNKPKWEIDARKIGEEWMLAQEKSENKRPGVIAIAKYVEGELSNRGIKGPRGKFLDSETIKRQALTGITGRPRNGKKTKPAQK
jgi:hypothetical protein